MMAQRSAHILVVDDEKNILNTIGICLQTIGAEVTLCFKPQDVIHLLQNISFDVAFVDLKMTPMDGFEVLKD